MTDLADLFAQARDADIEAVAGVKLFRAGRRLRGPCPLCGASQKKKGDGAFSVDPHQGYWYCFGGCQRGGDVIDLEQLLRGGSVREAAERLAGAPVPSPALQRRSEPRRVEGAKRLSGPERLAREIFNGCRPDPLFVTPAAAYLRERGISEAILRGVGTRLRFNPSAKWGFDEELGGWIYAPAIVAKPRTTEGPTGGVHVTYLSADCRRKAALEPAKRMWGPQRDLDGRPGGVWLLAPRGSSTWPHVVGEGIESTLSAAQLCGGEVAAIATLSLEALQGGWLTDKWGRIDPSCVTSDPERPAFTWPAPIEVLVAVDRDMKPIRRKVRKVGGGTAEVSLGPEDRARICAGLAVQAWKRAGANAVRAIAPAAGRDFNDELRERVGA